MFGKDKESKEFFEVFKKPQEKGEVKNISDVLQKEKVNPTVLPRPNQNQKESLEASDENQNSKLMGWIKDTQSEDEGKSQTDTQTAEKFQNDTKKPRRLFLNEVVVKQETLIFAALGAVFLSLACFFIGYKIGNKDVLNPEVMQDSELEGNVKYMPRDKEIKAVNLSPPLKAVDKNDENTKWTLQIISYSNTKQHIKKARDLAKAIKNMTSYNTFVAKRGNEFVVCMGKFNSKDSKEMKKALKEISRLEYEGKKQFTSSYPIQVR